LAAGTAVGAGDAEVAGAAAGGGVAFSAVADPGTTIVEVESLRVFSSSAAFVNSAVELLLTPYFSRRAVCSAETSALFFKRTGLSGSEGLPPAKP